MMQTAGVACDEAEPAAETPSLTARSRKRPESSRDPARGIPRAGRPSHTQPKDILMAILKFSASAVAAQIAHARACKTFLPNWNGPVDRPALILIVGNGVHCAQTASMARPTRIVTTEQADPSSPSPTGMNPFRDTDWMAQRRMAFRDLTGQFYTDIWMTCRFSSTGGGGHPAGHRWPQHPRLRAPGLDYLIGGTLRGALGLGGTFRVILKDACDTFAIVQNCGNSAFWEFEDDEAAPMSRERAAAAGYWCFNIFHKRCEDSTPCSPTACRSMR